MDDIRRILVAIDLGSGGDHITQGSERALRRAVWLARRVKASLTLLHSQRSDEYWEAEADGFVLGRGSAGEHPAVLESVLADVAAQGIDGKLVLSDESAWLAILREVLRERIDLVVASKRTSAHTDDRRLGTVARKLLRKCPCAVWLEDARRETDPSVILAAADMTPVGDRAIELAAGVASALGAELHVVHAYSLTLEAQLAGGEERRDYEAALREAATSHIRGVLEPTPLAAEARVHVGLTSPAQAILDGVKELGVELVVMGTVSRGGIPGVLVGNTAERLIDRLDCALLTIKPRDFVCPVTLAPEA